MLFLVVVVMVVAEVVMVTKRVVREDDVSTHSVIHNNLINKMNTIFSVFFF
jgi:hypothetical protein